MKEPDADLDRLANEVIGAAIEVHKHLGPGFLESVYAAALACELRLRGISFSREVEVPLDYKGNAIGKHRVDFLIDGRLIVELKAVEAFVPIHMATAISYLKAAKQPLALLINFNVRLLKDGIKRVILTS